VAQTVDWNPAHLLATLKAAHRHPGTGFIHVIQRCPHYSNELVEELQADSSRLLLLTHADGIGLEDPAGRIFESRQEHDPSDIVAARALADRRDVVPIGLFYRNDAADRYDLFSVEGLATSRRDKVAALDGEMSQYAV
jgi:2-oxoglutarate ferredoxin oxidoreductase subunit beta